MMQSIQWVLNNKLKLIIAISISFSLFACRKKEPGFIKVWIKKNNTFVVEENVYSLKSVDELGLLLAKKRNQYGRNISIVFTVDYGIEYKNIKPMLNALLDTGPWMSFLQMDVSHPVPFNLGPPDGPPLTEIKISVIDDVIYIDDAEATLSDLKRRFNNRSKASNGLSAVISCDDSSRTESIYNILKFCDQYDDVYPILNIENDVPF